MQKTVTVVIECLVKLNGDRTGQGSQMTARPLQASAKRTADTAKPIPTRGWTATRCTFHQPDSDESVCAWGTNSQEEDSIISSV